jgi:hypothetical protein
MNNKFPLKINDYVRYLNNIMGEHCIQILP